jgi:nucleoside-diphosphate-sugar epimerase
VVLKAWIISRRGRGWTVASLGPNEARILFDVAAGLCALGATVSFLGLFGSASGQSWPSAGLLAAPFLFVAFNAVLGLYTRLKIARATSKARVLVVSVLTTALGCLVLGATGAEVVLWSLLLAPPVVLARLLLALPFAKYQTLVTTLVLNRHGPVAVLGGAGYIGCHAVELLLQKGYEVRVLDRLMYGRVPVAEFLTHPRFELIEGDVTDIAKLTAVLRNASAVVHLAGLVGDPACAVDPAFTRHTNIVATRMAKDVAQSMGIYRFVFASSCSVYGVSDTEVDEQRPVNPVSVYAQTKVDSEKELLQAVRDDFFVTVLRFATVFGHSRRPRFDLVANLFTGQAMTDGRINVIGPEQWRPFISVRDLGRAIVLVLESPPQVIQSQVYNVGDRKLNLTIGDLAALVARVTHELRGAVEVLVHDQPPQDRRNYAVSFEKIRSQLGFEAASSLTDGVREMAQHFAAGTYRHYAERAYNNLAATREAVEDFHDPLSAQRLYAPLSWDSIALS